MNRWLLDTGPIVSFLDSKEPEHEAVSELLLGFEGRLMTTTAVITEAMHFVAPAKDGARLLLEFLLEGGIEIFDLSDSESLIAIVDAMEKYDDLPMDFADATLVLLAERFDIGEILTLDRRGFRVFRRPGGAYFRLMLDN